MTAKYRSVMQDLLAHGIYLTDSGLETTLIYQDGMDLPCFASFVLIKEEAGRRRLQDYYRLHAQIALDHGVNFMLESVGWRASSDWGEKLGIGQQELDLLNTQSIQMLLSLRDELERPDSTMIVSGSLGPRGDAYQADSMDVAEASRYHLPQIATYCAAGVDIVTAYTLTNAQEALGIVLAAKKVGVPVSVSFTLETDGRLPNGQSLAEAIAFVDNGSDRYPNHYLINCAHPVHFLDALRAHPAATCRRVRGARVNASKLCHADLDNSTSLDSGDSEELAGMMKTLREEFPWMNVLGGCCGTDHRHVRAIAQKCL